MNQCLAVLKQEYGSGRRTVLGSLRAAGHLIKLECNNITDYFYGRPLLLLDKTNSVCCIINLVALIKTVLHMSFRLYFPFQISDSYIYNYIIFITFKMCISLIHFMHISYSRNS